MSKYTDKDAAKDTGSSGKETAQAHHDARTDSGAREGKDKESFKSAPDWADKSSGHFFPKGKSGSASLGVQAEIFISACYFLRN